MSENIVQLDESWVRRAFLVSDKNLSAIDHRNSMWSDAALKFVDTTIGGNYAINPPPQFTRFCDVPLPSKTRQGDGIGPYYSEAIDDNSQIVHFRMGEARFNSLATFYSAAYNPEVALAGRTGRLNKVFFEIGRAAGFIVSIMSFKLLAVRALAEGYRLMMGAPKSRYYYHTPTMHTYWGAVTTILNQLTVNRGIVPRVGGDSTEFLNDDYRFTENDLAKMNAALPDVFRKDGGIDVYAVANKSKRMYRRQREKLRMMLERENINNIDLTSLVRRFEEESKMVDGSVKRGFHDYLDSWYETELSKPSGDVLADDITTEVETAEAAYSTSGFRKALEFFQAEADDGGMFATFRVNYTGSISESFSNSVGESEIQGKLNSMVSSARNINFSIAGGNIAGGVGAAVDAVKSMVQGGLDSIGLGGLAAIGGAAFFDIPKVWEQSVASMPRSNYTIRLTSPYGNPISQLFNIYMPMAMLLAMALPKSTGKQSYTSPFLIEYYDQGRAQSRLGMIDSMSFTRGTSSLGFNKDGHALAIDVSFSIVDMSSIMHMPISMGINPAKDLFNAVVGGAVGGVAGAAVGGVVGAAAGAGIGAALKTGLDSGFFDDDTVYSDYLAVLAGMGVNDQIYTSRKLKLALTRKLMNWKSWSSISNMSSYMGDLVIPGRLASLFYKGVEF